MTLVVNLFAGPGAGKSTAAFSTYGLLKQNDWNVEVAPEWAKEQVWEERPLVTNPRAQPYIFGKQYWRIQRLLEKVDIVLTDSPLLLTLVYGAHSRALKQLALDEYYRMWNLNILLLRVKPYHGEGRPQSEREAETLDDWIRNSLINYKIPYKIVPGDENAPEAIVGLICRELEEALKDAAEDAACEGSAS